MRAMSGGRFGALLILFASCRAVETDYSYPEDLDHPNYVKRSKAALELAQRKDASRFPAAFDLLNDEEAHIRLIVYETARELSGGRDFGYRPHLERRVREGTAARWRAWWEAGKPAEDAGG